MYRALGQIGFGKVPQQHWQVAGMGYGPEDKTRRSTLKDEIAGAIESDGRRLTRFVLVFFVSICIFDVENNN